MDPLVITQSVSFFSGLLTGIAFVLAVNTMGGGR